MHTSSRFSRSVLGLMALLMCLDCADAKVGCANIAAGYGCQCLTGFTVAKQRDGCQDVDECLTAVCSTGTCVNTEGSYFCYNDDTKQERGTPVPVPALKQQNSAAAAHTATAATWCVFAALLSYMWL